MAEALITLLIVFVFFAVAAVIVGAFQWWVNFVEGYDSNWESEGNRPRW